MRDVCRSPVAPAHDVQELPRLSEFDREEWWDVARRVRPDLSREEYERMWDEYHDEKARRELH